MERYDVDTLIADVRTAIDENTSIAAFTDSGGNIVDTDTLEMEDIIRSKVIDGINAVHRVAPLDMLELSSSFPTVMWTNKNKGIGYVRLPSDFLRLGLFKMTDWAFGVSEALSPLSEAYRQQFSEWCGVRGNPLRPVIAISADSGAGRSILQFFSCASTNATAELMYVKALTEEAERYEVEAQLYRAIVLKTAALTASAYTNADVMKMLNSLCNEQLGITE